ncbi:MAG: STAS domain-containing protein [Magnetospirillum sp.]|nr:STAS domain-containing protein [Magnetospirillum sp.]
MEIKDNQGRYEIELPAVLDLAVAPDLRDTLLDALSRDTGAEVVLKAAAVERVSTACVQVVLAAARGLAGAARRLEVERPSAAFASAFTLLGLEADLEALS